VTVTRPIRAIDQPFAQSALPPQTTLHPPHPSIVVIVVVSNQVKEAVQCQHAPFGQLRMPGITGLPTSDSASNHDIAQDSGLSTGNSWLGPRGSGPASRKTQHVCRLVDAAKATIQSLHMCVGDDRDVDEPARTRRCNSCEPAGQAPCADAAATPV
jgi:hypothetical protein